jgi:hypothetical protein
MFKEDIEKYNSEANTLLGSIKRNKDHVQDVNKKFDLDVNLFKDESISHITELTDAMLEYGDNIITADVKNIEDLEKENKSLIDEITIMRDTLQSEADQPYRLFISCLSFKHNLHLFHDQLKRIKENNTIKTYDFTRDSNLERMKNNCKQLGTLQEQKESDAGIFLS